jgi:hypothetical protein
MARRNMSSLALLICLAAPSCNAALPFDLTVGESCDGTTLPANQTIAPVVEALKAFQPPVACIRAGSTVVLSVTDAHAARDTFGGGEVEVILAAKSVAQWSHFHATHFGKELVVLRGKEAVLHFVISEMSEDSPFVISASSLSEAMLIAGVLRGEIER